MVCRLSFLFEASPVAGAVVAWVGALTAIFAATIGIVQTDIKKVLAYSTVSQLGYMFVAAGCGGYSAAIFHLGTHAFFKALLFLGAGAVILALHHEQDLDKMGGLARRIPQTHIVFLVGVLAIAGFPGLSGFFSKDEILVTAWASHVPGHRWLYGILLATAGITAFYMFRLYFKAFLGPCRAPAEVRQHIHEPSGWVVNPLWLLAVFAAVAGYGGLPQVWGDLFGIDESNSLANFLAPALPAAAPHEISHATEYQLALAAIGMAAAGTLLAFLLYVRWTELPGRLASALSAPYRLLRDKYYVDELYDALLVRPTVWISDRVLFRVVDAGLIDGLAVNGSARGVRALAANGLKYLQTGFTQSYIFLMIVGTAAIVGYLLR
jgi:NADH-quinone oxidoreductase subunit L